MQRDGAESESGSQKRIQMPDLESGIGFRSQRIGSEAAESESRSSFDCDASLATSKAKAFASASKRNELLACEMAKLELVASDAKRKQKRSKLRAASCLAASCNRQNRHGASRFAVRSVSHLQPACCIAAGCLLHALSIEIAARSA